MPCIFCAIVAGRAAASMVLADDRVIAFLDLRPWRPGHTLIVPRAHAVRIGELTGDDRAALFAAGHTVAAAMRASALRCDDVNLLLNDGPAANQTVPHVHLHVVPRGRGDLRKVLARLVAHAFGPLVPAAPRATLDAQAATIARALP